MKSLNTCSFKDSCCDSTDTRILKKKNKKLNLVIKNTTETDTLFWHLHLSGCFIWGHVISSLEVEMIQILWIFFFFLKLVLQLFHMDLLTKTLHSAAAAAPAPLSKFGSHCGPSVTVFVSPAVGAIWALWCHRHSSSHCWPVHGRC